MVLEPSFPLRVPLVGEQIGGEDGSHFEVREKLGEGGMGQVFRAWDTRLAREVALKFLLPRPGLANAALQEARAIARLDHENILRIFAVGEWRDLPDERPVPFLVMEYLEGELLSSLLQRERLKPRRALKILNCIAAGLAHAHERGLIHRDLKPSNVFLTRQGTVKLLDFGLAHVTTTSAPVLPDQPSAGTPAYMAPEQWKGAPQDARTDVWSAGVVLYEMLTGRRPFASTHLEELRARVTSAEPAPPVRARCPELPPEVESFFLTALAKEPSRRFPTARELREELGELAVKLGVQPETARSATPQRRQVTLMSCLLTGLSALEKPLDAESLGELEVAFQQSCSELIQRQGGSVILRGRGKVLADFGHPQAREDDAEHAVRAGLHLARSIREMLWQRMPELPLSSLAMKVGIQTDLVDMGDAPAAALGERALTLPGEVSEVADWLAEQAAPGEVLLGDTTHQLVRGSFELESLGPRVFAGWTGRRSLGVHRVLRERSALVRFDRTLAVGGLTPLVGREDELRRLLEHWEQARQGRGAFVLLRGEAGIGKSRLIRELDERVSQQAVPLRFQCWSQLVTSALHSVIQVLQRLLQLTPEATPQQRLEELEVRLGMLGLASEDVQVLGLLLSLPIPEDSPVRLFTPERLKEKIFAVLVSLLLRVARGQPLLVTIEDLHWADSSLLELLGFFLERVEHAEVLVVLSARPEFRLAWPRRPWLHELPVARLPAGAAMALVKEVARDRALPEETLEQLVSRTDGIPLFIEEMTRMVLERPPSGTDREEGLPRSIPVTLRELLLARLDMLSSRQKALLQLCAVMGRDFTHAQLAAIAGLAEEALKRGLAGLMEADLLQEREGLSESSYQFRHALIQEAAYQSLSRGLQRRHHRRIARILMERFPEVAHSQPEVLAHHSTEAGDNEQALHHWAQAGQLARMRSAPVESVDYITRALKLLRGLPDASQRLHQELQLLGTLGNALSQLQGVRSLEVARTYARTRELLLQVGEALPTIEPSYWEACGYYLTRAQFQPLQELAEHLVRRGKRQHDGEMRSLGYRMMATALLSQGWVRAASEYLERAEACARTTPDQRRMLEVRQGLAPRLISLAYTPVIYSVLGRPEQARRSSQEVVELASRIGLPQMTAYALTCVAMACQFRGDSAGAASWAGKVRESCGECGAWTWQTWSMFIETWAHAERENPREGLERLRRLLEQWRKRGIKAGMPYHLNLLARLHLKLGQVREGLGTVRKALAWVEATGERVCEAELHRLQGELLRADGKRKEARSRFIHALALARQQGAGLFELRAAVSLSHLLRDMGQTELAQRLLARTHSQLDPSPEGLG
jgi:class 3 adenylate cyclase/tetratricopeptide (TPR) repeat protein